jgi:hypothetical protein
VSSKINIGKNRSSPPKINQNEEAEELLDAQLSHACGDFNEFVHGEGIDHICSELVATPRRKKSISKKNNRVSKMPQNPITPSKISFK